MNLEEIKKNYQNFDDDKLLKLATDDINSLRKEVIPILEAELKKRNLSPTDKPKYSKEQFDNPFAKEKIFYSNEYLDYFKSNEEQTTNTFNEKQFFINKSLLLLITLLFTLIGSFVLLKTLLVSGSRLILFSIILFFIINFILSKLSIGKIAEIKFEKVILAKNPIGNFNIFRILILLQIAVNGLRKVEIPYESISKFYQKNELTNKGYYIEILENRSNKNSYRVYLEALSKNDRKELIEVIRLKIMKTKNDA